MAAADANNVIMLNNEEDDYGDNYGDRYDDNEVNEDDSFYPDDDMNNYTKARLREENAAKELLSVDPQLIHELQALKRDVYNAVVFGPPVGTEAAQDLNNLKMYESLLLELNNLLHDIFSRQLQPTAQQFSRFPDAVREPARLYSMKIVEFKNTNALPYLNDVLKDLFDRHLKEHPY
jgi:hypothetical protein